MAKVVSQRRDMARNEVQVPVQKRAEASALVNLFGLALIGGCIAGAVALAWIAVVHPQ